MLVDNTGVCKLADFGSAKQVYNLIEGDAMYSLKGTANWMAPEVVMQKELGRFSDIWSVGCVVIEMATGRPPWHNCGNQVINYFIVMASNHLLFSIDSDAVANSKGEEPSSSSKRAIC